jgi:serine/threonine protein phosphatase PrpC
MRSSGSNRVSYASLLGLQNIWAILADSKTSAEACQRLMDAALDNGGRDNVTVVLARYRLPSVT